MPLDRRQLLRRAASLPLLPLFTAGLPVPGARGEERRFLRIGTGSTAGTYFPIGGILATAISNPPGSRSCEQGGSCGVPGLIAVAQSTEGSVYNVEAIASGGLESGFSQADIAYWAYHGEGPYADAAPLTNLRAIANLYPESVQMIVRLDSGIRRMEDLKGKRISLDREGSGTLVDAKLILAAWDLTPEDLQAEYLSPSTAVGLLRKGELDGIFLVAGTPTTSIVDLALEVPLLLVPIDGEPAKALRKRYPFLASNFIDAGTYQSVPGVETLSVGAQWLVAAELPEDLVYAITQALWHPSTRRLLDDGHPKGQLITLDTALNGLGVPLHPGARRYYEDRNITLIE